jgi:hypothetical protein
VASIDATGHMRDLTERSRGQQPWPRIWTNLSTASTVVVAREAFADTVGSGRNVALTVLAMRAGRATPTTSTVQLPAAGREATR